MGKRILVIEDEKDIHNFLRLELENVGYEVEISEDGEDGLEKAKILRPDLILLDIMLPKLNGYTICSMLKGNDEYKSIPIIMLTARGEKQDSMFDEDVNPDAYIVKPFEIEALFSVINDILEA